MFRGLLLVAATVLFAFAALGAFGNLSGINFSGTLAVGLACLVAGVFDLGTLKSLRHK